MADGERESTMRRVVSFGGNEALHKGMNWTSVLGLVATIALGYVADQRHEKTSEAIASGAAESLAVLEAWKGAASAQLAEQSEQITRLREAVAVLRAISAAQAERRHDADAASAAEDVDQILQPRPRAPAAEAPKVDEVKRRLLGE